MAQPLASTQLYVWSQLLSRASKTLEGHLDRVFREARGAGFPAVEGFLSFFDMPAGAELVSELLREYGLRMPSVYTGGNLYELEKTQGTVESIVRRAAAARAHGVTGLTMNPDVTRERKTDEQLRTQAEGLNRLGERLRKEGVSLWVHNHDVEMKDDGREVRSNLDRTDPRWVGFCADTHWIWRGGGDPYTYLEKYGDRLGCLHLRNSRQNVWSEELGEGDLDHPRIARILKEKKFSGPLVVELAIEAGTPQTRPLETSQRMSREYLRKVFGV